MLSPDLPATTNLDRTTRRQRALLQSIENVPGPEEPVVPVVVATESDELIEGNDSDEPRCNLRV
jgi:hypothetical protein